MPKATCGGVPRTCLPLLLPSCATAVANAPLLAALLLVHAVLQAWEGTSPVRGCKVVSGLALCSGSLGADHATAWLQAVMRHQSKIEEEQRCNTRGGKASESLSEENCPLEALRGFSFLGTPTGKPPRGPFFRGLDWSFPFVVAPPFPLDKRRRERPRPHPTWVSRLLCLTWCCPSRCWPQPRPGQPL